MHRSVIIYKYIFKKISVCTELKLDHFLYIADKYIDTALYVNMHIYIYVYFPDPEIEACILEWITVLKNAPELCTSCSNLRALFPLCFALAASPGGFPDAG